MDSGMVIMTISPGAVFVRIRNRDEWNNEMPDAA